VSDPSIFAHDDHEIGLNNIIVIRELDISRSVECSPPLLQFNLRVSLKLQVPGNRLMLGRWRKDSCNDLHQLFIAFSVVWGSVDIPDQVYLCAALGTHEQESLEIISR
jgi:hypothetical protein